MTFLSAEVYILRVANETLSKRRRTKKARIRQGSIFTIKDTQDIILQKDVDKQVQRDVHTAGVVVRRGNRLGNTIGSIGKLVIIREFVKKL
jgi:hypothetical protein